MSVSVAALARVAAEAMVRRGTGPVTRLERRVGLHQIDLNLHLNYAVYLDLMELARWDWAIRTGQLRDWVSGRARPVIGSLTVEYRRELRTFARYAIETRAVGYDRRALVVEHCFLTSGPADEGRGRARETVAACARLNVLVRLPGGLADRSALERTYGHLIVPAREPEPAAARAS
jgi:acyl-CoA thioesterase FadM